MTTKKESKMVKSISFLQTIKIYHLWQLKSYITIRVIFKFKKYFRYWNIHIFSCSPMSFIWANISMRGNNVLLIITFYLSHCTVYHIRTISNVKIKSLIRKCFPSFSFWAAIYMHEDSEKMKDCIIYMHAVSIPLFQTKICFDVPFLI